MRVRFQKPRNARPPVASSVNASENSATTSTRRALRRMPPEPLRPPSFKTSLRSSRVACQAGAAPNRSPASVVTAIVKSKTGMLILIFCFRRQHRSDRRHHRCDRIDDRYREKNPERATEDREHQTLSQKLREQPRSRSSERSPQRNFTLARRAARKQQVRDVDTTNQQQKPNRAEQQPEIPARRFSHEVEVQRLHAHATIRIRLGKLALQLRSDVPPSLPAPARARRRLSNAPSRARYSSRA